MVLGAPASGITALGRTVLSSLGVEVKPILLDKVADGPAMFAHFAEVMAIASEMKNFTKTTPGSSWAIDRRGP